MQLLVDKHIYCMKQAIQYCLEGWAFLVGFLLWDFFSILCLTTWCK